LITGRRLRYRTPEGGQRAWRKRRTISISIRNPANYQPLTPLGFLERAAAVFPDHIAIIHGPMRRNYAEFYVRARRLASALSKNGVGRGDIVSVFLANTPAMLECHYGAPMCQGVLDTLNTRLDAPIIAFSLDHADAKVVITDREYSKVMKEALGLCKVKPLVIDYDDPEYTGPGERLGKIEYEEFLAQGDANYAWKMPDDEWDAISLNYTSGTTDRHEAMDRIEVFVTLPTGQRLPQVGKIVGGGYEFDPKNQGMEVMVDFPNPGLLLRPGLQVTLDARVKPAPSAQSEGMGK
jgi:non-ribosomal peptide synthetase component F